MKPRFFSSNYIKRVLWFACLLLVSSVSNAKTHPSYLSEEYCDGLVEQFIDSGMRSLGKYINEHFSPEYKGGIRNTIHFLEQRSAWLGECNDYLLDTGKNYLFYSEKTTNDIFAAIDALAKELQHVRQGVEYPDETGNNNPTPFIKRRYETLAKLIDQHHTRMLMKKQFQ
ncbi:hypothetical protein [Microbulbifer thermotolerans]|uniref:Lysozyme inhibitor LprI N-terminal domain-containing protein n=1 Tax=Microbulbifer thermotolerans TaxID=252514 RepID=A0A143HM22_MICTH|nr:hypothetical protein [Microbulbifer thermotolerans]AMX02748.1 hypothetical protein A3224_09265 [Microbulbifer thermotolerans]MCX2779603.1 hypothetical protein [Microbulbifer thermotolerans]MCX2782569.1 hypothetical protein [Microbulbifer thermotolerans]MCX2794581.1 hypothetical protein [Microbulbifer thermotolerans]MCX2801409.1 hypothetical protein [Microbulbifer thermotolerans]